ncbi:hypothetical protein BC938DRAFT_478072 [Jimgerdemannia flammicorona]|uniref:VHS domain-containing protein n=1 Tax=Jimgerdemannia flammicorona TaxID=994334 RepID=A0A433QNH2_9FUNG|nr:hypothetical protein BC938DRAFT_478072 [Jimgerdemannia flammicorona]
MSWSMPLQDFIGITALAQLLIPSSSNTPTQPPPVFPPYRGRLQPHTVRVRPFPQPRDMRNDKQEIWERVYSYPIDSFLMLALPREAAVHIVRLVNSRNMNVALQALTLLDNCAKNCGYPFHLQIATKEFLNELVRKFPERPNPIPDPVTQRILYLIKEWKMTVVESSRHKEDLVHIKDMYRLLRFKGYRFPELRGDLSAALQPSDNLKSPEELEEEDRVAQSAVCVRSERAALLGLGLGSQRVELYGGLSKGMMLTYNKLIRRGRPQDLVEANELMKIMAGYDQHRRPNYKQQANEELDKIRQKAILLNDMLQSVRPGENIDRNETILELRESCRSAQPKIQKFVTEEEDPDNIEQLLALNDMINGVMQKYEDVRRGILDTRYDVQSPSSGGVRQPAAAAPPRPQQQQQQQQQTSLIDFDGDFSASAKKASAGAAASAASGEAGKQVGNGTGSLIDDLLGLSFDDHPGGFGIGGSIALPSGVSPVISAAGASPMYSAQSTAGSLGGWHYLFIYWKGNDGEESDDI